MTTQQRPKRFAASTLIAALTFATAFTQVACTVDADDPLFIIHNQSPDTSCALSPNKTQPFVSRGVLDTGGSRVYVFTPLVESRATSLTMDDPLQRAVFIEGAEVNLVIPDGVADVGALNAAGALNFTQRFSGTLEPGALSTYAFDIVPSAVTDSIAAGLTAPDTVQILAEIEIFGSLGGGDVSSPVFTYPITFCENCRVDAPSCVGYMESGAESCFPGQDNFPIECCVSEIASPGALVCPPVAETAPEI